MTAVTHNKDLKAWEGVMSKDELLQILSASAKNDDTEDAHADADNALIVYIADKDITKAYEEIHKWYS